MLLSNKVKRNTRGNEGTRSGLATPASPWENNREQTLIKSERKSSVTAICSFLFSRHRRQTKGSRRQYLPALRVPRRTVCGPFLPSPTARQGNDQKTGSGTMRPGMNTEPGALGWAGFFYIRAPAPCDSYFIASTNSSTVIPACLMALRKVPTASSLCRGITHPLLSRRMTT